MKIVAALMFLAVLGGSAHASERQNYIHDVKSIAKANQKRIHRYERNPPAGVAPDEAGIYESLIELDLYLLNHEIHQYEHSASTRAKVEAKLAQLSRDVEDAPEVRHEAAQKIPLLRKEH